MSNSAKYEDLLTNISNKCEYWQEHLSEANEAAIGLIVPELLELLGISQENIYPQYPCSKGKKVDFAARIESFPDSPEFALKPNEPDILIEVKKPTVNFSDKNKKGYASTVKQLQGYLREQKCKSVGYGIILNGIEIQLFRKHGMTSYPISPILFLEKKSIKSTISYLTDKIQTSKKARGTILTVWNNKGGVGKSTIAQSLGILLSEKQLYGKRRKNKILIIDYDHNQGDLTENCGLSLSEGGTKKLLELDMLGKLTDENIFKEIDSSVRSYTQPPSSRRPRFPFSVDILVADLELNKLGIKYKENFTAVSPFPLRQLCLKLSKVYDYIIIDAPPNYEQSIFSREAVMAADCILPIALYVNKNSIRNYAEFVVTHIANAQNERSDGGPYSLGIWFNRWKSTWTDRQTKDCVKRQIEAPEEYYYQAELHRIFYNSYLGHDVLRRIPECADIARSIMDARGLPGVVRFIRARNALNPLLKDFTD